MPGATSSDALVYEQETHPLKLNHPVGWGSKSVIQKNMHVGLFIAIAMWFVLVYYDDYMEISLEIDRTHTSNLLAWAKRALVDANYVCV